MDVRQIRYFLAVARHGSFSRAARALGMTQPPLSTGIANLERELGVRLFARTSRGIRLTPAGELLTRRGDRIVRDTEDLTRELQRQGQGLSGSLTLAVVLPYAWAYLPKVLTRYRSRAPHVDIGLADPGPDAVLDGLLGGTIDVAIVATGDPERFRTMYDGVFHIEQLTSLPLVAALPAAWSDQPDPIALTDLVQHTLFLPRTTPRFPGLTELVVDACLTHGLMPPQSKGVANLQTSLTLISAGLGAGIVPPEIRQLSRTTVLTRQIEPELPRLQIDVVWSQSARPNEVVTGFLETLLRRPLAD